MSGFDPKTSRELISIDPRFASIKVLPNTRDESSSPNFPRNLHNAAELFLKLGLVDRCVRLSVCTKKLFNSLEQGPDGRTQHDIGRAAVCFQCGHAGLPANRDACGVGAGKSADEGPRPVCAKCLCADDTNFVKVLSTDGKEVPWMEGKPKPQGEDGGRDGTTTTTNNNNAGSTVSETLPLTSSSSSSSSSPAAALAPSPSPVVVVAPAAPSAVPYVRKVGVSSPTTLSSFVSLSSEPLGGVGRPRVVVVDVRNPDFSVEPGDEKTCGQAPLPPPGRDGDDDDDDDDEGGYRPRSVNVPFDRKKNVLNEALIPAKWIEEGGGRENVSIITHCGGGGRGQKAKEYLESKGFKNVVNGGGPEDEECWKVFGAL